MRRRAPLILAAFGLLSTSSVVGAQRLADLSGTWTVPGQGRTIEISVATGELTVRAPSLTTETYKLDGSEYAYVRDFGRWWTKYQTRARWDGTVLTLTTVSFTGWWQAQRPTELTSKLSEVETRRILMLSADGTTLTMKTESRDVKPYVVRHLDVLVRSPRITQQR